MARTPIDLAHLSLPRCAVPRPGHVVQWFLEAQALSGQLIAHDALGRPIVRTPFGSEEDLPSFHCIRRRDPVHDGQPNWSFLPGNAVVVKPDPAEVTAFGAMLAQVTPPGPRYSELIYEIWARGHEVFLVGGSVRDTLRRKPAKDVDLVTSMPILHLYPLLCTMYGLKARMAGSGLKHGHVRLGGSPNPADPFIDLCVFTLAFRGTGSARFGNCFLTDAANRDFTFNAVYYDPLNQALIDPTGRGLADADSGQMWPVFDKQHFTRARLGELVIRGAKFMVRGYTLTDYCKQALAAIANDGLRAMPSPSRISYIRTQVLRKAPAADRPAVMDQFREALVSICGSALWDELVAPHSTELLA